IDRRTGTIVAGRHRRACCFGINDVAVGAGAVWIADLSEKIVRASLADARVTGITDLGTIPLAVTVAYGTVWLAVPDPGVSRLALWRVDQQTMRVTQTITTGKSVRYLQGTEIASGRG